MSGLFYNLGRRVGPKVRKASWVWQSMTGTEADMIKVENEVGRDLAYEVRCQLKPDADPETRQLLGKIGSDLAKCVANRYRTFSFEAVEGGEPNAFALPGGFIFITRSLIELCRQDADEVAFVLGHEMAHVIRGHAMERIISNSAISTASRIGPARGLMSGWLKRIGVQFLESAYSQDIESEADRLGVALSAAANYDPYAATRLLSNLAKVSQGQEGVDLGEYFSSHPAYQNRIENINRIIRQRSG